MIRFRETLGKKHTFIDTRSPGEFEHDHIPGAVNIPIFNNEERAIVGTIYSKIGKDEAYEKGKGLYDKKLDDIKRQLKKFHEKELVIYCWRGGMRSKTITELAKSIGMSCRQLSGGYKRYREYVRKRLEDFRLMPRLIVLHGLTGTGKTELLQHFSDMIDLEGLAEHRSSVFGAIGLKPRSQKMFESLLLVELDRLNNKDHILIEGESRKIGNIIIPESLFKAMKQGINVKTKASIDNRADRLVKIYTNSMNDIEKTREITLTLKLGKKTIEELVQFLDKGDLYSFMKGILEKYYDPLYNYSIKSLDYDFAVDTDDIESAVKDIRERYSL